MSFSKNILLKEIGDANAKSFDFNLLDDSDLFVKYQFQSNNFLYKVYFNNDSTRKGVNNNWSVTFGNATSDVETNFDATTNKGELFSVMSTVIKIIKDFIKRHKHEIDSIYFKGTSDKRDKLYSQFMLKNFNNSEWKTIEDKDKGFILTPVNKQELHLTESKKFINKILNESKNL